MPRTIYISADGEARVIDDRTRAALAAARRAALAAYRDAMQPVSMPAISYEIDVPMIGGLDQ